MWAAFLSKLMVECRGRRATLREVFRELQSAAQTPRGGYCCTSQTLSGQRSAPVLLMNNVLHSVLREPVLSRTAWILLMRLENSPNIKCSWWARVLLFLYAPALEPVSAAAPSLHAASPCLSHPYASVPASAEQTRWIAPFAVERCCLRYTFTLVSRVH